jgi:hypothetical protein
MIRRSVAGLVLGLSLFAGSLAWSGFLALSTVLDPGRSEAVAESLYDDPQIRDQLTSNLVAAFEAALPEGVALPPEQLEAVAAGVLEDPAVEALITEAFVQTHAAFLGEGEPPRTLDAGAIGAAARGALVSLEPGLDAVLPPAPELVVELPTDRVPDAGPLRRFLQAMVPVLALSAAAGVVLALLLTTDRPSVLRRAGRWAISTSAFALLVGLGLPWLIVRLAPEQAQVVAALFAVLLRSVVVPAVALAAAGVVALLVGAIWSSAPASAGRPASAVPSGVSGRPAPAGAAAPPTATYRPPDGSPDPPPLRSAPGPVPATPLRPARSRPEPRWVEGVGWVQHPLDEQPPDGARWVPGVGYVLDRQTDTGQQAGTEPS